MKNRRLIRGIAFAALVLVLAAAYFSTIGHCFLPHRNPETFVGEQLEMRIFSGFVVPDQSRTWSGLFAAAEKIDKENPGADPILKRAWEELGYAFPSGCYARSGPDPMVITHYPS